ncbi:hypothetical protein FDP41_013348 [Naegleria fowleri]|uniref:Uncharacterized protein n=1 Tax=Naegleria fowleri TaxID=5763 RepID=A0A6A5BYV5_NAEFO|nr:uncharacterized protein FDP41_013348 [Naegleria fowleri]KAF0980566.1 hypothetical protein FDP41_013348 [Naegleria fowleri]
MSTTATTAKAPIKTLTEDEELYTSEDTPTYKAIGRMYITKSKGSLKEDIGRNIEYCEAELKKLQETRTSILKRIEAEEENFRNIFQKIQQQKAGQQK